MERAHPDRQHGDQSSTRGNKLQGRRRGLGLPSEKGARHGLGDTLVAPSTPFVAAAPGWLPRAAVRPPEIGPRGSRDPPGGAKSWLEGEGTHRQALSDSSSSEVWDACMFRLSLCSGVSRNIGPGKIAVGRAGCRGTPHHDCFASICTSRQHWRNAPLSNSRRHVCSAKKVIGESDIEQSDSAQLPDKR